MKHVKSGYIEIHPTTQDTGTVSWGLVISQKIPSHWTMTIQGVVDHRTDIYKATYTLCAPTITEIKEAGRSNSTEPASHD